MAIGKASDFKIYEQQFFGGVSETLMQNANVFNAASANSMRLVSENIRGQYRQESFIKTIGSLVTRRDTTSVSAATDLPVTQGELIDVKVNRKIGPVSQTLDSFKKIGLGELSPEDFSTLLGEQAGVAIATDFVNAGIRSVDAALSGQAALNFDATGASTTTMTHGHLVTGLSKFGDKAPMIKAWVMHSKVYYDLVGQAIADKVFNIADISIASATTPTLGRPVIITDAVDLVTTTSSGTTYATLGLVEGACVLTESEDRTIVGEIVTGLENLVVRMQGEFAFNVGVKGFQWDITNGGANPNDTALGTATNWDKASTDNKSLAGVRIITT